jgi:hypothetical protein
MILAADASLNCSRMAYADHFNLMSGLAKPEVDR